MILLEFDTTIRSEVFKIKYKSENEDWKYLYVDLQTLNLLIGKYNQNNQNEYIKINYLGVDIYIKGQFIQNIE